MMAYRRFLVLAAVAALLLIRPSAWAADEKPTRLPLEPREVARSLGSQWYGVYFKDRKIGYLNSVLERVGKGDEARLVESSRTSMKMVSLGQKAELQSSQRVEFEARPPYRLLRAESTSSDGKTTQVIRLVAHPEGGFDVTVLTGKSKQTRRLTTLDFTLADSLSTDVWLRRKPRVGERITVRDLDLDEQKTNLVTNKLLATKTSLVAGVKVVYHELESLMHKMNLRSLMRCDSRGRLLSGTIGELFELRRESEVDAKNTRYSADVFVLGMVKIDGALGEPTRVTGLVVEIPGKDGEFLKSGPRQTVTTGVGGTVCKVGKTYARPVKATAKEIEENLEETTAYPIGLPRVKELARKAVGDARTPAEKVKRLVQFAHDYIRPSLGTNLPKLEDLLDRKAGDCKSYALLFNALARAAGIPAREVGGLMYMGDGVKAFGGHAWNEVVLDGHWVPVDASLVETEVNATHIRFGTERDSGGNLLRSLGKLSFRLVEVQRMP
jgi:hypothetical protein